MNVIQLTFKVEKRLYTYYRFYTSLIKKYMFVLRTKKRKKKTKRKINLLCMK